MVAKAKHRNGGYGKQGLKITHICSRCGEVFEHKPLGRYSKKASTKGKKFCSSRCFMASSYIPKIK